jgi:hypothetical protein
MQLAQVEIARWKETGIEPEFTPVESHGNHLLFRCRTCQGLVWRHDKKKQQEEHYGHQFGVAQGGTPEEAILLTYDLI